MYYVLQPNIIPIPYMTMGKVYERTSHHIVMEFEQVDQVDQLYWLNLSLLLTRGGKNPFHLDDLLHEQRKYTVAAFRGGSSCLYSPSNW